LKKIALPREQIGFVSSNCWDALGASSFGFSACWINRQGAPLDRLGSQPARIVRGLDEILL
jgi:2-haloacid dehalogenase